MTAKLTTQEFIDRARAVHGDKYRYEFVDYKSAHKKVFIFCSEHGLFEQTPNNHLSGKICHKCSGKNKLSSDFINESRMVHGDRYDYSLTKYVSSKQKVCILCQKHGLFEQIPNSHLSGQGCPSCGGSKKLTTKEFIKKAKQVHGSRYDYSLVTYIDSQTKITITCKEHGEFEQIPPSHVSGKGCPGCAEYGFDRTKSGFLYVLRSDCGQYMKIGITHNPKQRHGTLIRTTPFSFECIEMVEGNGEFISNLEKELLAEYQPVEFTERFDGSTEWRLWNSKIVNQIKQEKFKNGKN